MTDPLEAIRQLYFRTSVRTIDDDFDRAVELLKAMPSEAARARATVFMQGLAEMKKEWRPAKPTKPTTERRPATRRPKGRP